MGRIVYNKERSGKLIGRGGPRDLQQRQKLIQEESMMRGVFASSETGLGPQMVDEVEEKKPEIDLSQYLPLAEVRKKIEEAVVAAQQAEIRRYETQIAGFPEISDAARDQLNKKDIELVELTSKLEAKIELYEKANKDVEDLKTKLESASGLLKEGDIKIAELQTKIRTEEDIYGRMQEKLDSLYEKIADGSISPLVGSKMDRPALEDKIFIDPLELGDESKLDAYIEIQEEKPKEELEERNMKDDLAKLRNLLKSS